MPTCVANAATCCHLASSLLCWARSHLLRKQSVNETWGLDALCSAPPCGRAQPGERPLSAPLCMALCGALAQCCDGVQKSGEVSPSEPLCAALPL